MCAIGADIIEQEVVSFAESSLAKTTNGENAAPGAGSSQQPRGSDILDSSKFDLRLDKSNILMLGPTGCGQHFDSLSLSVCLAVTVCYRLHLSSCLPTLCKAYVRVNFLVDFLHEGSCDLFRYLHQVNVVNIGGD